jgi:2'-5' RNA ligase
MGGQMRVFAAVVPAPEAVEHLDTFLEPRRAAADFRWTRPEQLHLTLAFMAAAQEHRVDDYVDRLAESLDDLAPAPVSLAGAVVFPNVAEARVLAAGLAGEGTALLDTLAVRSRNAAVASGIEVDGQRFRPHVTIARTGGPFVEMTSWVRLLDGYEGPAWPVGSVAVVASHLGEGPRRTPRYETLAEVVL